MQPESDENKFEMVPQYVGDALWQGLPFSDMARSGDAKFTNGTRTSRSAD
jgi:hypothetical protein